MAQLNKSFLVSSLVLMILGALNPRPGLRVRAAAESCENDLSGLMSECVQYVQWTSDTPEKVSAECCAIVQQIDFECVCGHVDSSVETAVSMEKAVTVARICGRDLKPGTKCGSYTVTVLPAA